MSRRLAAIARVVGVEIVPVPPRAFRDVAARLSGLMPIHTVIVCRHFCPHVTPDAVPDRVPRNFIHFCDSTKLGDIERQITTWIDIVRADIENQGRERTAEEGNLLLATMLRLMVSHSKIGQFNHCPKETVLKCIRARRLDVAAAEVILDENSELFQDTRAPESLFLWKDHHDGRQYFLNPKRIEYIKLVIISPNGQ
jgi:hypothetical protein